MIRYLALPVLFLLSACGGDAPVRIDLPPVAETGKVAVSAGSVEVREVTLPRYASQETIVVESETGALVTDESLLWADDPIRSFTEGIAFALAAQTRARVAAEPWPFSETPDVRIDIRFSRALPGRDGRFRIEGQYYVAGTDGQRADVARRFALSQPFDMVDLSSIAGAKARLIADLAALIARDGL